MDIVLLVDIKGLGVKGQKISVEDGYAINYLLPNKKAVSARDKLGVNLSNEKQKKVENLKDKHIKEEELFSGIAQSIELKLDANTSGKLFQTVSGKTIAKELNVPVEWISFTSVKEKGMYEAKVCYNKKIKKISIKII